MTNGGIDPKVKDVVLLLGSVVILTALVVFPALGVIAKTALDIHDEQERKKAKKEWEKFNLWRLRATIKRLQKQKIVKARDHNGSKVIVLTEKGRTKFLEYKLDEMTIRPSKWDGKWRLIIYDISKHKTRSQRAFREMLKRLKFLMVQKSVYLFPYPCEGEIESLKQYYDVQDQVMTLTVKGMESEEIYKKYFGL